MGRATITNSAHVCQLASFAPGRVTGPRARFASDEAGVTSMMFGLMAFTTLMFVGAAVDLTRWSNARSHTIDAIDAAVLAAARSLQTGAGEEGAKLVAREYYASNTKSRPPVLSDSVSFEVRGTTIAAVGSAYIRTPFMGMAYVDRLPLFSASEGSQATSAEDASANYNREVALMLDVSGSMCSPCTKRDDMKAAAKDLAEIMMKNNGGGKVWSKIAVVPFSSDVRPSAAMFASVTDPAAPADYKFTVTTGGRKPKTSTLTYARTACTAERAGDNKYTDAAPGPGNYINAVYAEGGGCAANTAATIAPLTLDKAAVLAKINGLTTGSGTAGHLGTAWSYYMLSPKWNAVLPAASQASAYGTKGVKKIAVLMTDGEYNQEYDAKGIDVGDKQGGDSVNGTTSAQQAIAMCADMKKSGIDVYTVGFALPNATAVNTMNACASDASMAYTVATGEQLRAAFRDIAVRTTHLHLSK